MKKTKGTITVLLILAILILGVGYALANIPLNINGTLGAKADSSNFKVKFLSASKDAPVVASTTVEPVATPDISSDLLATFTVKNFTCNGDKVVLKYVVKNESTDLNATVTTADKPIFGNQEYFSVVSSFAANETDPSTTINAGQQATLYVTVTCIKTPTADVADAATEGIVTLTASVAAAEP